MKKTCHLHFLSHLLSAKSDKVLILRFSIEFSSSMLRASDFGSDGHGFESPLGGKYLFASDWKIYSCTHINKYWNCENNSRLKTSNIIIKRNHLIKKSIDTNRNCCCFVSANISFNQ